MLDPETGYLSHPQLTCGPYNLIGYDAESGVVDFELNPWYAGNWDGVVSYIDTVTLVPVTPENMVELLQSGEVDILNKVVDGDCITRALTSGNASISYLSYARLGYGFVSMACEQGPQQFTKVRQALACMIDADSFVAQFLQNYGLKVNGFYGLGQWMTQVAMGVLRPADQTEEEAAAWDEFTLDSLDDYAMDYDRAVRLL